MSPIAPPILRPHVVEDWRVVDRWWTDSPIHREYAEVRWGVRQVTMFREAPDPVWHIAPLPAPRINLKGEKR